MEPAALAETEPASLGSDEMEPAPKGSGETEPAALGRDLLIRLEPSGEVNVGANFLSLGIPDIDTQHLGSVASVILSLAKLAGMAACLNPGSKV